MESIQPPQQPVQTMQPRPKLSGWWRRVWAVFIDVVIFYWIPSGIIVGAFGKFKTDSGNFTVRLEGLGFGLFIAVFLLWFLFMLLMLARKGKHNGQTPGKQMMGIRVHRNHGQPVTFGSSLLREFVVKYLLFIWFAIVTLFIITFIDYFLWPLVDSENQALHDKMVGTHVVRARSAGDQFSVR